MPQTELDIAVAKALGKLRAHREATFDYQSYIRAFLKSAQRKAEAALAEFNSETSPFRVLTPLFVSVGGGDGEELRCLLKNSSAQHGILIEQSRLLADQARQRAHEVSPKKLTVIEGDAQAKVREAVEEAARSGGSGADKCIAVTCHAVIHELYDRSEKAFDLLGFLGGIFSCNIPTWLTYREPGLPEKWPDEVLLSAACSASSLLELAEAIRSRHASLRELSPEPSIVGDHLRMHRALAMELLAKLFYLEDIEHEINERSTAVDHNRLINALSIAIGDSALREKRALVRTSSAPTDSFVDLWSYYGVDVIGVDADSKRTRLPVAESQTRVIAWRIPLETGTPSPRAKGAQTTESVRAELIVASDALARNDELVVTALVESLGRAWIESSELSRALALLSDVSARYPPPSRAFLWSNYNSCLARLFAGETVDPEWFSERIEGLAQNRDLRLLYRAERMEFCRRRARLVDAIGEANTLRTQLAEYAPSSPTSSSAYTIGTAHFVLGNLLRHGRQYDHAFSLGRKGRVCVRARPAVA